MTGSPRWTAISTWPARPVSVRASSRRSRRCRGKTEVEAMGGTTAAHGMRSLAGGEFAMGSVGEGAYPADGEGPVRRVRVSPFAIGAHAVTIAQFAEFVADT